MPKQFASQNSAETYVLEGCPVRGNLAAILSHSLPETVAPTPRLSWCLLCAVRFQNKAVAEIVHVI
ncbi:hypothetical protein ACDW_24460 [Acidovorax sp. DW039]|uniref:hypothetical protein n=1 Tax=Acidovorax sp. DW039 TaxID=3095606 RepID=UPI00308487BD|nr:hypothetical protein ACDW_24460 [Acidovorax sp. DW039]